jgi:hypothetical protein
MYSGNFTGTGRAVDFLRYLGTGKLYLTPERFFGDKGGNSPYQPFFIHIAHTLFLPLGH